MKKVSLKKFLLAVDEIANEHGFDDPENAYWQCNIFSQAVLQAAEDFNVPNITLVLVMAEYQYDVGDVEAGYEGKHVLVKIKDTYYDWTIRQIDSKASFPYISKKLPKYYQSLGRVYSEDVLQGFEYYPKITEELTKRCKK